MISKNFVSLLTLMAAGPLSLAVPALAGTVTFTSPSAGSRWAIGHGDGQGERQVTWSATDGAESTTADLLLISQSDTQQYTLQSSVPLSSGTTWIDLPGASPGSYVVAFAGTNYQSDTFQLA